jgi:hypothetical protein
VKKKRMRDEIDSQKGLIAIRGEGEKRVGVGKSA